MIGEIGEVFRDVMDKCAESMPIKEGDYLDGGIIHCGICRKPKQVKIRNGFFDGLVACMCDCDSVRYLEVRERLESQKREVEIKELRKSCIRNWGMHSMTFKNDNGSSPRLMAKARKYAENWEIMRKQNVGLYIFGNVGLGKTYAAACIANYLIDRGVRACVIDLQSVFNAMRSYDTHDKNDYIESLCYSDLLIIDDFGAERVSEYDFPIAEQLIDARANYEKPLIITSNVPYKVIENPTSAKHARMFSRITGMTVPIALDGEDKRQSQHKNKTSWAKEFFNEST